MSEINIKYKVGIDEVGRGPLAGPVVVCALSVPVTFDFTLTEGIKDSKKLTEKKRKEWVVKIDVWKELGLRYKFTSIDASVIDEKGITFAITSALNESLNTLQLPKTETLVLLDGGLKAPAEYIHQETIIKGDEKEAVIAMASIVAKVFRDDFMCELDKEYPEYGLAIHKGYGTAKHIDAIKKYGMTNIHRRTWIK
jgi:ribonuclease HII